MLSEDVIRRLTVIASDTGLTTLKAKLDAVDNAQDRVAVSGTRMARATDDAQKRIAAMAAQASTAAGAGVGALAGRVGSEALLAVTRFGPAVLAGYAAFKLLNETISQGTALLEKYGLAGQRAMFGEGVDEGIAKLTRFQGDKTTLPQQKYAAELSGRLDEANRKIKEFFKVQLDLADPALRLQNAWVVIAESIEKALNLAGRIPAAFAQGAQAIGNSPLWNKLNTGSNYLPGSISSDQAVARINAAAGNNDPAQRVLSAEEAMQIARGRLSAGLGQNVVQRQIDVSDRTDPTARSILNANTGNSFTARFQASILALNKKPDDSAPKDDEFDRMEKSLQRQIAVLKAESEAVGGSVGEHAKLRTEMRLQETAMQEIAKSGGTMEDYEERIKKISERMGEATQKAAELKLQNDITFERSQLGRDPIEANVASRLRPIYGDKYVNEMDGATAAAIRFNEQMKISKDLTTDFVVGFAGEFRSELRQGATAFEALGNAGMSALTRLSDKLMDMYLTNLVSKAFGGGGGNLFSLFGGGGDMYAAGSAGAITPQINAGIGHASMGGIVGVTNFPTKYIHPAYFENAPRFAAGGMITDDGVPIIAHPGERILNRQETAAYAAGGKSDAVHYHDNRTFNDVTPAVEARMEARMRAERPKIIAEVMAAMKKQRGRDPNTYGAG